MRHLPRWPGMALLAACHDPAGGELSTAGGSLSRIPDRYALIDLGTLPGDDFSYPTGLNNRSEVTGTSGHDYITQGFSWNEADGMTELGVPAGYSSVWTSDINDRGLIVGTVEGPTQPTRGVVWDDGAFELIEPPPGGSFTGAYGINRAGDIVGVTDFTPDEYQAFLLQGGELTELGRPEGETYSVATAINSRGDIIGFGDKDGDLVGLLWEDGGERMIDLSEVLSIPDFVPYAISQRGELAGYSQSLNRAVFVEVGGQAIDLGSLAGPEGFSQAWGINRQAQVVGTADTPEGVIHAFVWEDGVMVDLNDLIDPDEGAELEQAMAINDNGEIAAMGLTEGERHAFLLRPE